jgi:hypothetical protein
LELDSAQFKVRQEYGAELTCQAETQHMDRHAMSGVAPLLEGILKAPEWEDVVDTHSWASYSLLDSMRGVVNGSDFEPSSTFISNVGRIYSRSNAIYAVSPNFFDVAYPEFLQVRHDTLK